MLLWAVQGPPWLQGSPWAVQGPPWEEPSPLWVPETSCLPQGQKWGVIKSYIKFSLCCQIWWSQEYGYIYRENFPFFRKIKFKKINPSLFISKLLFFTTHLLQFVLPALVHCGGSASGDARLTRWMKRRTQSLQGKNSRDQYCAAAFGVLTALIISLEFFQLQLLVLLFTQLINLFVFLVAPPTRDEWVPAVSPSRAQTRQMHLTPLKSTGVRRSTLVCFSKTVHIFFRLSYVPPSQARMAGEITVSLME